MYKEKVYDIKIKRLELVKDERDLNQYNINNITCKKCLACKACRACILSNKKSNIEDKLKFDVISLFEETIQKEISYKKVA